MKKKALFCLLIFCCLFFVGCQSNTQKEEKSEANRFFLSAEKPYPNTTVVSPVLDYDSADTIVFHDYYGTFVYSLKQEKMLFTIDQRSIGYRYIQGDGAVFVRYDEENKSLFFFSDRPELVESVPAHGDRLDWETKTMKTITWEEFDAVAYSSPTGTLEITNTTSLNGVEYHPAKKGKVYYPLVDAWE